MELQAQFNSIYNEFLKGKYLTPTSVNTASVLIFKEYLKSMRLWYEALGIYEEKWYYIYRLNEGHNLVHLIAPELLNNIDTLETFAKNYSHFDRKSLDAPIVYGYICWELFKNYPQFEKYKDLPNPYENVVKIMQRGNYINRGEMKTIEINSLPITRDIDLNKIYLPSVENDFLDFIDKKCKRMGSAGIPNPEKVEELWEEFQKIQQNG